MAIRHGGDVASQARRCYTLVGLFFYSGAVSLLWAAVYDVPHLWYLRPLIVVATAMAIVSWPAFALSEWPSWRERHVRHIVERRMRERRSQGAYAPAE